MSEPKLISPLLDKFIMGDPISEHDGVQCCTFAAAQGVEANGSKGAGDSSDQCGQNGHQQSGIYAAHDESVLEKLLIPVEREAGPDSIAVAFVEREDNQQTAEVDKINS